MEAVTEVSLSSGWVAAISNKGEAKGEGDVEAAGEFPLRSNRPVLQVASLESVRSKSMQLQYLLKLSDGVHCVEGLLFSKLNHLVIDGVLRTGAVLRALSYICTNRQNRRFIVVMQVEIIKFQCRLIGSPQLYDKLESKSEQSIASSATSADLPSGESYSGGLSSSCIALGSVEDPNILEHNRTCDGFHSPEKGGVGSSAASVAKSVVLKTVAQIENENFECSDNKDLLPSIALVTAEGPNSLEHNKACDGSRSAEQGITVSSIASKTEPGSLKTIAQIKHGNLGCLANQDLITVNAIVSYISTEDFCYAVCPLVINGKQCNAKLTGNVDDMWQCDMCKQSFTSRSCDYKFVLIIQISDPTGMTWAFAFQEAAEDIFGRTAKELYLMKYEEQDSVQFDDIVESAQFRQYLFKLKVERLAFDGKQVMKCTVVKAEKLDPLTECSEFGSSMAAMAMSGFSNSKARCTRPRKKKALLGACTSKTECTCTVSPGGGMHQHQFSADRLDQLRGNAYGDMPAAVPATNLQACSACGFALFWAQGTTAAQVWAEQEGSMAGSSLLVLGAGLNVVESNRTFGTSKS